MIQLHTETIFSTKRLSTWKTFQMQKKYQNNAHNIILLGVKELMKSLAKTFSTND